MTGMRFPKELFRERRQRLLDSLGDGLLLLPTAKLRIRNGDVFHSFRPDSDFYYLTGLDEPEAFLAAHRLGRGKHRAILFVRPRDPMREVWDGPRLGPAGARRKLGVDEARPVSDLYLRVEELLRDGMRLFHRLGDDEILDRSLSHRFREDRDPEVSRQPRRSPSDRGPAARDRRGETDQGSPRDRGAGEGGHRLPPRATAGR